MRSSLEREGNRAIDTEEEIREKRTQGTAEANAKQLLGAMFFLREPLARVGRQTQLGVARNGEVGFPTGVEPVDFAPAVAAAQLGAGDLKHRLAAGGDLVDTGCGGCRGGGGGRGRGRR